MERESHPNKQLHAANHGIPLPHSALEAGLGRFSGGEPGDGGKKKESKKKAKTDKKTQAAARTLLGGQIIAPDGNTPPSAQSESVSTWRKLLAAKPAGEKEVTAQKRQAGEAVPELEPESAEEAASHQRHEAGIAAGEPPLTPPPLEPWMHEPTIPANSTDLSESRADEHLAARDLSAPSSPEGEPGGDGNEPPEPPVPPGEGYMRMPPDGPENHGWAHGLATGPAGGRARYETTIPPGMERTPADVTRAAWMGVALGWLIGRRGKGKAVKRAVEAVEARYKKLMTRNAAQPAGGVAERAYARSGVDIEKQPPEARSAPAAHIETNTVRERTMPSAAWVKPETAPKVTARTMERLTTTPLPEALALPAVAVAVRSRAERAPRPVAGAESDAVLGKDEMMQLAKTIKVEGVPLSEIYSSKQIDEEGLRAVIETYLRGGDVQRRLSYEIVEKQKSFERDPHSRKRSRGQFRQTIQAFGQAASAKAAEKGADVAQSARKTAGKTGQSLKSGAQKASTTINNSSDNQLWLGVTAIAIIWTLILFLILG